MVILVNLKDNYDTAITTASKSMDFDLNLVLFFRMLNVKRLLGLHVRRL